MKQKRTTEPRSEYIMVRTDPKTKKELQEIAEKKGWSLSLVGHTALQEWLRTQAEGK